MIGLSDPVRSSDWRVVGVGSPHGDDQVGWRVVDALRGRNVEQAVAIRDPSQLLDCLSSGHRAVIVDACVGQGVSGTIHRAVWPDLPAREWRLRSTHHLDIQQSLELAALLGRMPLEVVLIGIVGEHFRPGDEMGAAVRSAVDAAVERVLQEMSRAMDGCHA
jgi:hydrogenase maturation protease